MSKLKEYIVEIPVAGVYKYRSLFDDSLSEKEIINKTINMYNGTSQSMQAYKCMIDGEGIKFPLSFARATKV
jgi:hypothetical protein